MTLSMMSGCRWDYSNKYYYDAIDHLMHYQQEDKIRYLGLTNFDTEHLADLLDEGAPIVSNQVAYSLIDTRPQKKMAALCKERNVKLLCYGTLLVSVTMFYRCIVLFVLSGSNIMVSLCYSSCLALAGCHVYRVDFYPLHG
jgi:Aldo/keto reductase family